MSVTTRTLAEGLDEISGWQEDLYKDLHANPELAFQEVRTRGEITRLLTDFGYEVREIGGGGSRPPSSRCCVPAPRLPRWLSWPVWGSSRRPEQRRRAHRSAAAWHDMPVRAERAADDPEVPLMRTALLLTMTVLLLSSCGDVTSRAGDAPDLTGRTFLSTGVADDGAPRDLVDGSRVRLTFEGGRLSAQAGCNTMFGGYEIDGDVLVVEGLGMTEMGCPGDLAEQDAWLSDVLTGRPSIAVDGDELTLTSGTTVVTLTDRVVADPDRPLVGSVWRVDSLISGDAVSSTPGDAQASLVFGDDGTVQVRGGCNTGSASYTAGEGTVTIGPVRMTRMACDDERGELETAVLRVLDAGELQVKIEAGRLTLTGDGGGLGLKAD